MKVGVTSTGRLRPALAGRLSRVWAALVAAGGLLLLVATWTSPLPAQAPPLPGQVPSDSAIAPDTGRRQLWNVTPWIAGGPDAGTVLGVRTALLNYGLRPGSYASLLELRAGYGFGARAFAGEVLADLWSQGSGTHLLFHARASGTDILRFYGFGNSTPATAPDSAFLAYQREYLLSAAIGWSVGQHLTMRAGPLLKYSSSDFTRSPVLAQLRPYGTGNFGQVGAEATLAFDTRDAPAAPTRGVRLTVGGGFYPALWDVASSYGRVRATAATYLTPALPLRPTLALRVGGERVWGAYPFQESATLGGMSTVRGLLQSRFRGDASAFGNAELRIPLGGSNFIVPGRFGVFGLADAGRIWLAGESSNTWHTAFGGGLWFAPLNSPIAVSAAVARGDGRTVLYLGSGFGF
jgi:outer membrane protein assembly factor BamA